MQKNTYKIYFISILLLSSCSHNTSKVVSPESNDRKMENNKVKVSIEQQKNKIIELEELIIELNNKINYQENMLNTISSEFKDQIDVINRYESSSSEITKTLIKMKNKFEVLEDKAFYTDSIYFEIINDLVTIDSKIEKISEDYNIQEDNVSTISDKEYSKRYYKSLDSFINNGVINDNLNQFKELIKINSEHELSDNCQYWIGEIYYKQKKFQDSINEFRKVFSFSKSNKSDDAQYKIILSYINLNNKSMALNEIDSLRKRFPNSEYIKKANNFKNKLIK